MAVKRTIPISVKEKVKYVRILATGNQFQGSSPESITLQAKPYGFTPKSYAWYLGSSTTKLGSTQNLLVENGAVTNVNSYRVVVTAQDNSAYEETISISKVIDGSEGAKGINLLTIKHLSEDAIIGSTGSNLVNSGDFVGYLDYVEIDSIKPYFLGYFVMGSVNGTCKMDVFYYNSAKGFISKQTFTGSSVATYQPKKLTIPSNAKFLRFNFWSGGRVYGVRIKLEQNDTASSYTPSQEDLGEAFAPLQTTEILGGTITTGVLGVSNNNRDIVAGITGEGFINPADTVIWSGESHENKDNAPFRVQADGSLHTSNAYVRGTIEALFGTIGGFRIENNNIVSGDRKLVLSSQDGIKFRDNELRDRITIGVDNTGVPSIKFFDESGNETWSAGTSGIIYTNYIAESYTTTIYTKASDGNTFTETMAKVYLDVLFKEQISYWSSPDSQEYWTVIEASPETVAYLYSYHAGKNPESEHNKQYEGYYYKSNNKLGSKVDDGWYITTGAFERGYGRKLGFSMPGQPPVYETTSPTFTRTFHAVRIVNGKVTHKSSFTAQVNLTTPGPGQQSSVPYSNVLIGQTTTA